MSRRLVCVVSVSKLKGGGGFPGKLCEDLAWLVTMQQDGGGGKRGQLEEENSRYSSPVDGGCIPLAV